MSRKSFLSTKVTPEPCSERLGFRGLETPVTLNEIAYIVIEESRFAARFDIAICCRSCACWCLSIVDTIADWLTEEIVYSFREVLGSKAFTKPEFITIIKGKGSTLFSQCY